MPAPDPEHRGVAAGAAKAQSRLLSWRLHAVQFHFHPTVCVVLIADRQVALGHSLAIKLMLNLLNLFLSFLVSDGT